MKETDAFKMQLRFTDVQHGMKKIGHHGKKKDFQSNIRKDGEKGERGGERIKYVMMNERRESVVEVTSSCCRRVGGRGSGLIPPGHNAHNG